MAYYLGSKAGSGVYQNIIELMPPHHTYIETHLGSGSIMDAKKPVFRNIGIEINQSVLDAYIAPYPVEKFNMDAIDFLNGFEFKGGELIYADPPYLHCTRTSNKRYEFEYNEDDHVALLDTLKQLPCPVMISGYYSDLYNDLLSDWQYKSFNAMTHGGPRREYLWFNYEPKERQELRYIGDNFTHRQQIKRKAQRWCSRFTKLPHDQKQYILSELLKLYNKI